MINDLKPYPAMKDSGVPWLGEVPEHWDVSPAFAVYKSRQVKNTGLIESTVLSLSYGRIIVKAPEKLRGLVPESFETYQIIKPGNIIVRTTDLQNDQTSLRIGHSHHRGIITSAYMCLETRPIVLNEFGYQYLNAYDLLKIIYGFGSGLRQSLDFSDIKRMPVLVPSKAEQSAIIRFLDHADRKIRRYIHAKQKLIKLLEEQKQAIIHRAVTRGLDPDVRLKDSGVEWLGDIPEHWQVKRLHRVTDPNRTIMYGIVLPGPNVDDGVYIVKGGNCEPGRLRPELLSRTTFDIEARYARSRLAAWDIVFAIRGGVGAAELVPQEITGANLTQDAARIAAGGGIDPRWLLHAVRAPIFQEHVQSQVVGATVRGVNIRDLKRIELVVPPAEEQSQIVAFLGAATEDIVTAMGRARYEVDLLHEYRTRLIADVVTGKLDVRDAAAGLPEEEPVADESLSEPYDPDDAEDSLEDESFPSEEQ